MSTLTANFANDGGNERMSGSWVWMPFAPFLDARHKLGSEDGESNGGIEVRTAFRRMTKSLPRALLAIQSNQLVPVAE